MASDVTQAEQQSEIDLSGARGVFALRSTTITEAMGRVGGATVDAVATDSFAIKDVIGSNATIRLTLPNGAKRFWNWYVSTCQSIGVADDLPLYRLTLVPWLWFLGRTADFQIFQGKDVPAIAKAVFADHTRSLYTETFRATYLPWDHCTQYRETDLNFLQRLFEQEGIYYFFKHENGKHTLALVDDKTTHKPCATSSDLAWRPSSDTAFADAESVFDVELQHHMVPNRFESRDFDFKKPKTVLSQIEDGATLHAAGDYEVFDFPGEWEQPDDGKQYAAVRLQEHTAQAEILAASTNARGVSVGGTVTISDHPSDEFNRKYLVTSTAITFANDPFQSGGGGDGGASFSCRFTGIDAGTQFRTPRVTPKTIVQGPQTAVVVGPAGSEVYTDEFGRVKIQFHWDRYGKRDDKTSSFWCRVSQPWAGKNWGAMFIPRIGMEVVVSFLEGDPDQPLITGCVYNGENMPPYALPAHATRSTIKTNSSKGGGGFNEIRLEDKKDDEQIFVNAQKRLDVRVGGQSHEFVADERHLIVEKDHFELSKTDRHTIVKGDTLALVEGSANAHVKGDAMAAIDGAEHRTVKGDRMVKAGGDDNLDLAGNLNVKTGKAASLKAGTDLHVKTGMKVGVDAGMTVHIKAGMSLVIEAGVQVSIKAGASFIDIGPAGVAITGPMVMINSGGAAGSGAGASPVAPATPSDPDPPKKAKPADTDKAGQVTKTEPPPPPPKTKPGPQASVLIQAAKDGVPFCAKCEAGAKLASALEAAEAKDAEANAPDAVVAADRDITAEAADDDDPTDDDEKRSPERKLADDLVDAIRDAVIGKGGDAKAATKLASNAMKAVGDRLREFAPDDQKQLQSFLGDSLDAIAKNVRSGSAGNLHRELGANAIDALGKALDDHVGGAAAGAAVGGLADAASKVARGSDDDKRGGDATKPGEPKKRTAATKKLLGAALGLAVDALGGGK